MWEDRSEAGHRPVADLLARASSLLVISQIAARCRSATSFVPVCDQDSVMEFGFNATTANNARTKRQKENESKGNLNQQSTLRTPRTCARITVHNCRTQYSTEQF